MADETTHQGASDDAAVDETVGENPARDLPDDPILAGLAEALATVEFTSFQPIAGPRQDTANVPSEDLVAFVQAVKDAGFETFIDLCAVDHLNREPRYDVVINLLSMEHTQRLPRMPPCYQLLPKSAFLGLIPAWLRSPRSTAVRTSMSARPGTCSGSSSMDTPI